MKFLSIIILSCLAFSSVHAVSEFSTDFEELGEMFDQGTLPQKEDTFGWWSGRCYLEKEPSKPRAVLLASRIITHPHNGGTFPSRPAHQMMFFRAGTKAPADYYDNDLSKFKDSAETELEEFKNRLFITTDSSVIKEEERVGTLMSTDNRDAIYSIRKYEDYFVGQVFSLYTTRGGRGSQLRRAHYANCYFFKKVH